MKLHKPFPSLTDEYRFPIYLALNRHSPIVGWVKEHSDEPTNPIKTLINSGYEILLLLLNVNISTTLYKYRFPNRLALTGHSPIVGWVKEQSDEPTNPINRCKIQSNFSISTPLTQPCTTPNNKT